MRLTGWVARDKQTSLFQLTTPFLLLLQIQYVYGNAGKPVFIEPPTNQYALQGHQVTLKCIAKGEPPPVITWLKAGNPVEKSDRIISHQMSVRDREIIFYKLLPTHEAFYQCQASNEHGVVTSERVEVRIAYMAQQFRTSPQSKMVSVDETVLLECDPPDGLPPPEITWKKDGNLLPSHLFRENTYSSGGLMSQNAASQYRLVNRRTLRIDSARLEHSGRYQCVATNMALQRESEAAQLIVRTKPKFIVAPKDQRVFLNGTAVFTCRVSGDPKPMISWRHIHKNGERSSHSRWRFPGDNLEVVGVQLADAGQYSCMAKNGATTSEAVAELIVFAPPSFLHTPEDKTVTWGRDFQLPCQVTGNPVPHVRWMHNDQYFLSTASSEQTPSSTSRIFVLANHNLMIRQARMSDSGRYLCIASSYLGSVKSSAVVQVVPRPPHEDPYRAPFIVGPPPSRVRLPVGPSRFITCRAWMPSKEMNYRADQERNTVVYALQWTFQSQSDNTPRSLKSMNLNGEYLIDVSEDMPTGYVENRENAPATFVRQTSGLKILNFDSQRHSGRYICHLEMRFFAKTAATVLAEWSMDVSVATSSQDLNEASTEWDTAAKWSAPTPLGGITVLPSGENGLLVSLGNATFAPASSTLLSHIVGFYVQYAPMLKGRETETSTGQMEFLRDVNAPLSNWKTVWVSMSPNASVLLGNLTSEVGYHVLVHSLLRNGRISSAYIHPEAVYPHPAVISRHRVSLPMKEIQTGLRYHVLQTQPLSATELLVKWQVQPVDDTYYHVIQAISGFRVKYRPVALRPCLTPQQGQDEQTWLEQSRAYCSLQMDGIDRPTTRSVSPRSQEWEQQTYFTSARPWNTSILYQNDLQFVSGAPEIHGYVLLSQLRPFHCYEVQVTPFVEQKDSRGRVFLESLPGSSSAAAVRLGGGMDAASVEKELQSSEGAEGRSFSSHSLTYESAPATSPQHVRVVWWFKEATSTSSTSSTINISPITSPILNISWSTLPLEDRNGRLVDFWVYVLPSGLSTNTSKLIKVPAHMSSLSVPYLLKSWINETLTRQHKSPTTATQSSSPSFLIFVSAATCQGEGIRSPGLLVHPPREVFDALGLELPAALRDVTNNLNSDDSNQPLFLLMLVGVPALWLFLSVALLYACLTRRKRRQSVDKEHLRWKQHLNERGSHHHQQLLLSPQHEQNGLGPMVNGFTNATYHLNPQLQPHLLNSCHFPLLATTSNSDSVNFNALSGPTTAATTLFMPPAPNKQLPPIPVSAAGAGGCGGETHSPAGLRLTTLEKKRSNGGSNTVPKTSELLHPQKMEATPFVSPYASTTLLKGLPSSASPLPHNITSLIPPPPEYPPPPPPPSTAVNAIGATTNPPPPGALFSPTDGMMWLPSAAQNGAYPGVTSDLAYLHDDPSTAMAMMMMAPATSHGYCPNGGWYTGPPPQQAQMPHQLTEQEHEDDMSSSQNMEGSSYSEPLSEVAEEEEMSPMGDTRGILPATESLEGISGEHFGRRPSAQYHGPPSAQQQQGPFAYATHSLRLPMERHRTPQAKPNVTSLTKERPRRRRRGKRRGAADVLEERNQQQHMGRHATSPVSTGSEGEVKSSNYSAGGFVPMLPAPVATGGYELDNSPPASSEESENEEPALR